MLSKKRVILDCCRMILILVLAFAVNLILRRLFNTQTMTPMIFVLGVYLVAWRTQGYFWGIIASLISVLAVNFAFTYPYWAFDLIRPECLSSAVVSICGTYDESKRVRGWRSKVIAIVWSKPFSFATDIRRRSTCW